MKSLAVSARSVWARLNRAVGGPSTGLNVIVFSKDRAPQLDLLLRTYARHAQPRPAPLSIQYSASSPLHERAYQQVLAHHQALIAHAVQEAGFKPTLLTLLKASNARNVMFLVDDIVFIDDFDVDMLRRWDTGRSIFSLRLGANIVRSFNSRVEAQAQPAWRSVRVQDQPLLSWSWRQGELDWNLPVSLDGNVLPAAEILPIIERLPIKGPNSLEQALGTYRFLFKYRRGSCYPTSRLVNLPMNTVKAEPGFDFPNFSVDPEHLAGQYMQGMRLGLEDYRGMTPDSCHMEWMPTMSSVPSRRDTDPCG
ncbi:MAG: hypothetical protein K2Q07_05000 [Burkholderiaceae bacterium]|nr:hypothetical protein [Burkholderiaceae bacterium]